MHKQKNFHFFKRNLFCRIFHWKVRKWRAWTRSDVFVGDYFVLIHENAMCLPAFNSINVRLVESLIERKFCYYSWNYQQHLLLSTHWGFIELNWTGGCFAWIDASKRAINFQQSPYSISVQTAFSPTQFRLFRNFSWNAKVSIEVSFIKLASNLVMKRWHQSSIFSTSITTDYILLVCIVDVVFRGVCCRFYCITCRRIGSQTIFERKCFIWVNALFNFCRTKIYNPFHGYKYLEPKFSWDSIGNYSSLWK